MIPVDKEARLMLSDNADINGAACIINCWAGDDAADVRVETGGPFKVYVVNKDWCAKDGKLVFQQSTGTDSCPLAVIGAVPTPVDDCRPSDCAIGPSITVDTSGDPTVKVTILAQGTATFGIDWGDGSTPDTGVAAGDKTHAYAKPGTYTITVTNEKTLMAASKTVKLTHAPANTVTVTKPSDQTNATGDTVSLQCTATDSDPSITTFTWSATGLPTGLTIDTGTGKITGTPTKGRAAANVTVTATDSTGVSGSATFKWAVTTTVTVATIADQTWTNGTAITDVQPTATDSDPSITTFTWSISPTLPAGVTMSTSTGKITGTPTATSAQATYTITATDSLGAAGTKTFKITVS